MYDVLAGTKGWFLWNGSALGPRPVKAIERLGRASGAQAIAVKTYDGPGRHQDMIALTTVREGLEVVGPAIVGAWGYHYGADVEGELAQVRYALKTLRADFVILNVEDPAVEANPRTAELWAEGLKRLRDDWPHASLYFCGHARPQYHEAQPYYQAMSAGLVQMPMAYHTAMQVAPWEAIRLTVAGYTQYELIGDGEFRGFEPWSAAGGCYDSPGYPITVQDIKTWAVAAVEFGATSLIWWSADWAIDRLDLLEAVRDSVTPEAPTIVPSP